jgi:hypothetical protein
MAVFLATMFAAIKKPVTDGSTLKAASPFFGDRLIIF